MTACFHHGSPFECRLVCVCSAGFGCARTGSMAEIPKNKRADRSSLPACEALFANFVGIKICLQAFAVLALNRDRLLRWQYDKQLRLSLSSSLLIIADRL